jgi:hypothetical protein
MPEYTFMDDLSIEDNRLKNARHIYEQFCHTLRSEPDRAKSQWISQMQILMRQAYEQGKDGG